MGSHACRWPLLLAVLAVPAANAIAAADNGGLPADLAAAATADGIFASGCETQVRLTITNYLAWCSVTANRGSPNTSPSFYIDVDQGRIVPLHGDTANATYFIWGYWNGTDAGGADTNQDPTVTMTADKGVFACCPLVGQTTCP